LPITLDEWTTKVDSQREVFRKSRPLPGVPELLANLAWKTATPVRIALASSASRPNFAIKTSQIPFVSEAFPEHHRVFGSDEAMQGQNKKPAPDIFLLALHQVNGELTEGERKILPQECLVFEDSIAGVEAGRRAGMRVVWVPHEGLREVYKGHEDRVLEGKTEESGHQVGAINMEIGAKGNQGPLRSHDGDAQMLTSLEDFPYCDYGIHLK